MSARRHRTERRSPPRRASATDGRARRSRGSDLTDASARALREHLRRRSPPGRSPRIANRSAWRAQCAPAASRCTTWITSHRRAPSHPEPPPDPDRREDPASPSASISAASRIPRRIRVGADDVAARAAVVEKRGERRRRESSPGAIVNARRARLFRFSASGVFTGVAKPTKAGTPVSEPCPRFDEDRLDEDAGALERCHQLSASAFSSRLSATCSGA